jgi:hypothetical protein
MFSIHHSHRFASAPGHMTTVMTTLNITSRSPCKADFQPAPAEGPRPLKVCAQREKIACEAEKPSLRSLKNVTASVHRDVQSGL